MTNKGKHSSHTPGTFYRDLFIMILGIILVGAIVFFVLYILADSPSTGPTTTTTVGETSTSDGDSTSTTTDSQTTTTQATTSTSAGVDVRPPSEVTVVVLNSIGLDGAAGRLTTRLTEAGYQALTPDDYEPEQNPSRIWYREGFAAEAAALLEFLAGGVVEALPSESVGEGADVVLVLGTGYEE